MSDYMQFFSCFLLEFPKKLKFSSDRFSTQARDLFSQSDVHDPNRRRENGKLTYWKNDGGENNVYMERVCCGEVGHDAW